MTHVPLLYLACFFNKWLVLLYRTSRGSTLLISRGAPGQGRMTGWGGVYLPRGGELASFEKLFRLPPFVSRAEKIVASCLAWRIYSAAGRPLLRVARRGGGGGRGSFIERDEGGCEPPRLSDVSRRRKDRFYTKPYRRKI